MHCNKPKVRNFSYIPSSFNLRHSELMQLRLHAKEQQCEPTSD